MSSISVKEVKERLIKDDSFSAFVYLKGGKFFYDTELKEGCIGVLSTDIASMLDGFACEDDDEATLIELQIANAKSKCIMRPEYRDNEVPTSNKAINQERLVSGIENIFVCNLEKAKNFCDKDKLEGLLVQFLKEQVSKWTEFSGEVDILVDSDILNDVGLDSLDAVDFIMKIEETLGIEIPYYVTETISFTKKEFRTVRWIASFLVQQIELAIKTSKQG